MKVEANERHDNRRRNLERFNRDLCPSNETHKAIFDAKIRLVVGFEDGIAAIFEALGVVVDEVAAKR